MNQYKIAVIEGDGIGREVVPEGLRVLEAAGRRYNATFSWKHFDWSCETFLRTGRTPSILARWDTPVFRIMYHFGDCSFPFGGASSNMSTCGRCACYKASNHQSEGFLLAKSTSVLSAKTMKASTPK